MIFTGGRFSKKKKINAREQEVPLPSGRGERCVLELDKYQNVNKRKGKKKNIIGYGVDNFTSNRNAAPVGSIIVMGEKKEYQFPVSQKIGRVNHGSNRTFHLVVFAMREREKTRLRWERGSYAPQRGEMPEVNSPWCTVGGPHPDHVKARITFESPFPPHTCQKKIFENNKTPNPRPAPIIVRISARVRLRARIAFRDFFLSNGLGELVNGFT